MQKWLQGHVKVTVSLKMCSASKRCSVSGFNCIYLNPDIKLTLIELQGTFKWDNFLVKLTWHILGNHVCKGCLTEVKVTVYLKMCSASKRCTVSGFNCIYLNLHIKITPIELPQLAPQLPQILELASSLKQAPLRISASPIGQTL